MGHLSVFHLGAVGLGAMIFNFLYWNFGFLRMGTTGLVAQAYGANDHKRTVSLLGQGLVIGLVIGCCLWIAGDAIKSLAADLLLVDSDTRPLVYDYYDIVILGAPATICIYALVGWFFGMQDAWTPMIVTILLNVINICLSYFLVMHADMGIRGAAIGTVVAQYMGTLVYLIVIATRIHWRDLFSDFGQDWKGFVRVNVDLFIRTVALTFAFAYFYRQSSALGTIVLAANVVLLQFLSWMSYGIDGFAHAAESLVGKYKGGNKRHQMLMAIRRSFAWGGGLALVYCFVFGLLGMQIAALYTDDITVLAYIDDYIIWLALLPLGAFVCYIWDGIFIGVSASRAMRDAMILSLVVYLGAYAILGDFTDNAIWISFILFLVLRGVFQTWIVFYGRSLYGINIL